MKYSKAIKYNNYLDMIMGPNPLKLAEELLENHLIPDNALVMDLGSGSGLTSLFMTKEYGFKVYAADLWSDPDEVQAFFDREGLSRDRIKPVHADACELPFENNFFDAVVSVDSYNYFGRDKGYLDQKLLPFVKKGGYIYICIPGMKNDCHEALPRELLVSWNAEQLDYIHDTRYWRDIFSASGGAELISVKEMQGNEELWHDWVMCDNQYAREDKKAVDAGACKYLNFVAAVLRKK